MLIVLLSRAEYDLCKARNFEPLTDPRFDIDINLRVQIQADLFPTDEHFYKWIWEHRPHICEETGKPLYNYSAAFISHIMTRGAHPQMRSDPRNINILSYEQHNKWEFGKRETMRIYPKNQCIIEKLKTEYSLLK